MANFSINEIPFEEKGHEDAVWNDAGGNMRSGKASLLGALPYDQKESASRCVGKPLLKVPKMIMRRWGVLQGKEEDLLKDLKEITLSFKKLGKRYGVSRQAVHAFSKRHGIERPGKPKGHQIGKCRLCQKLIQISKKPHSKFISIHTIVKETGGSRRVCRYHLRMLRDRGLVDEKFGRLYSKRAEKAYAIYFKKRLPIRMIGRKVGLKNFHSIIQNHRKLGWNVPPSLYVYGGRKKSRIQSEIQWRKQR